MRAFRRSTAPILAAALLASGGGLVQAQASGPIPVTACGTVITQPGQYALTQNIGPCPGTPPYTSHAIDIEANNVSLDLQGHTLSGADAQNSAGIWIGYSSLHVTVSSSSSGGLVTGFSIGFGPEGPGATVTGVSANNNTDSGFWETGQGFTCRQCVANGNGYFGFQLGGKDVLSGVVADGNGEYGIYGWGEDSVITGSEASSNWSFDMYDSPYYGVCGSIWLNNTFGTANRSCIH